MRRSLPFLSALVLVAPSLACVHELPPPATPEAVVPALGELPPVPEGRGRVVVDVADGPTEVRRAVLTEVVVAFDKDVPITATSLSTERLCDSPCVVDLEPGRYTFAFPSRGTSRRLELDDVDVRDVPTVYRRALGSWEGGGAGLVLGIVSTVFGGMSFATGATLLPVGLASESDGMSVAGGITLGVGSILLALGITGIALSPDVVQPGAALQFELPQAAAPAPAPPPASAPAPAAGATP